MMKALSETIEDMNSADYTRRFVAEYQQTKIRYEKLKDFIGRIELATIYHVGEEPVHDCPTPMLKEQLRIMGSYLDILEKRAIIEKITLA